MVKNLGWVELNLGSSLGWLAIQWVATAQAGWWNIPNTCQLNQVRAQMGHPVFWTQLCRVHGHPAGDADADAGRARHRAALRALQPALLRRAAILPARPQPRDILRVVSSAENKLVC